MPDIQAARRQKWSSLQSKSEVHESAEPCMVHRVLDVFLSSTARDLEPHRRAIHAELTSTGLFHCQEDFESQDAGAVEFCREKVKASDIFIGLTGQRRGWEPDGDNAKRSITEMEHDWAKEAQCRRYLYVAPDSFPVPGDLRDTDEQYERQQAFRRRVMDGGERIVSQKGFEHPERLAADIVKHLLTQLVTSELITLLRPELSPQSPVSPNEQRLAVAAAIERLTEDEDVDLLALAKNPNIKLAGLESKLKTRAETHEAEGQSSIKVSAEYWRHIGALAFLHNTQKALTVYEKAVSLDPLEPEGWRYFGELQYRLGDLAGAEESFEHVLALGKSKADPKTQAMGYMRLGLISLAHGNLPRAEALATEALRCADAAGWQAGMARAYVNLGNIHLTRGDLDNAEAMQGKAIALDEAAGNREGMAAAYVNAGIIDSIRGDLDEAEEMQRKALKLYEYLADKSGMAYAYGNLGIVYHQRRELDKAEDMQNEALMLNQEMGNKRGMALAYGNLGIIHETRGDLEKAKKMQLESLALYRKLDSKDGMARAHSNLGNIYLARGRRSEAEKRQRKALTLYQELSSKEGMAATNASLGKIYQIKGDKTAMCECWHKARDLYLQTGLPNKVAEVENLLKLNECGTSCDTADRSRGI